MYVLILTLITPGLFSDEEKVTYIPNFHSYNECKVAGEQFRQQNKGTFGTEYGKYLCVRQGDNFK